MVRARARARAGVLARAAGSWQWRTDRIAPATAQGVRFFLLQNRQGKTRLAKWYVPVKWDDKIKLEAEVHRLVTSRDAKFTNFVEVRQGGLQLRTALTLIARAHASSARTS